MDNRAKLFSLFQDLGIEYQTYNHPALFTVDDTRLLETEIPGAHTKNLFLKDDNKQFWLISALQDTLINLKLLAKTLPAKNLRFAQHDDLREYLQVEPGSVTWFALMNDKTNQVRAILDKTIFSEELVGFHPLENTATTVVKPQSLIQFVQALNHNYQLYEFCE